jgi:hypothetical protein
MYREWGENATGDGSYFTTQAPSRLGFDRIHDRMWIVKFQVENDTYRGRIAAYGDNTGGVEWISDSPSDPTFATSNKLVMYGNHGGGTIDFVVVRDDADAVALRADPTYGYLPQLRGGHCYYAMFENAIEWPTYPATNAYFSTATDLCGTDTDPECYYLAFDMGHRLHTFSGQTYGGNVIPGFTVGP